MSDEKKAPEKYPSEEFKSKVSNLPTAPGIYQYFDENEKLIYIGKAKNLRSRVRSYFHLGRMGDAKTNAMLGKIRNVEVILVDSEVEALILEDTLIKKHKPRYNVLLRDDKTYPYIKVTNELYPRLIPTRRVEKDGSKYFGPFTEVRNIKQLMKIIRTLFYIRSCDLNINELSIEKKKHRICLDFHIHKCQGPCEGLVSVEEYLNNVRNATKILQGKTNELEKILVSEMQKFAEEMKFEQAAVMRNKLAILKDYTNNQKIVSADLMDRDIFGLTRIDDLACTLVLKVRDGKLIGKRHYIIKNAIEKTDEQIMQRTIEKWYMESDFIPRELYLPCDVDDIEYMTDWLTELRGKSLDILLPKIGDRRKYVEMANTNAHFMLKEYIMAQEKREQVVPRPVLSLQRDLRLKNVPRRIECFDNSHLQGTDLVSSMVVFVDGKPKKSEYRKYKNLTVLRNDDFEAMREVIRRRYTRAINEESELPDLIIVDGGKGQLSSAYGVLHELDLTEKIQIIGLAKRLEEVFLPGKSESMILPRTSSSLRLIQQLRDEAHRFAITYHRSLRKKRTLHTELQDIKGIGKSTAEKLLKHFGSVTAIKIAGIRDLERIVNSKIALKVMEHFQQEAAKGEE
ncbi:MAG: excinuclease ABC subunit C [Candidatus Kapabacteria bacterium]|nr:excinuclease ABC subunit C [Candidatus Kapabacteria bacterium]